VGVLKAFAALGLDPAIVVGASVGAMVGALYAARMDASDLERLALGLDITDFLRLGGERGVTGDAMAIERFVNAQISVRRIEQLPRRFAATAVAMPEQRLVTFNHGNLGVAVRASSALPGTFTPARIAGVDYIDGDELAPVPCESARRMGADIVIAVDVSAHLSSTPPSAPEHWQIRDRRRTAAIARDLRFADVHVHPDLGYYADVRAAYRKRCIAIGEATAHARWPAIAAALKAKLAAA
jgi:NTE family protein